MDSIENQWKELKFRVHRRRDRPDLKTFHVEEEL